jgi:hypothetical protein
MRIGLDAFSRVEDQSIAVQEIPHDSERDVRIVAEPGIGQEDVSEGDDEKGDRQTPVWFVR